MRSLQARPRVFLGSSGRSYGLVEWLAEQIRSHELAIPIEWKSSGFAPKKNSSKSD